MKPIKEAFRNKHGFIQYFSGKYNDYSAAFKCVIKIDKKIFMSLRYPNLKEIGTMKTKKCVKAFHEKSKNRMIKRRKKDTKNISSCV